MDPNVQWPQIRERRLHNDFQRLQNLVNQSDFIEIAQMEGNPPERYVIRYTCKGIAQINSSREPIYSEMHLVAIYLPAEYPTKMPLLRWLSPIFHPNINAEGTFVCIDVWYPTKFLDDLCMMLGRMIQYQNYNPYNAARRDAAAWAVRYAHLLPVDDRPLQRGMTEAIPSENFEIRMQ